MRFAIISAGDGSRLANEGCSLPKPLVSIEGVPMIERLTAIFMQTGATEIDIIVNGDDERTIECLKSLQRVYPICLVVKKTASSMHSLYELRHLLKGDSFCLTTVDTVFRSEVFMDYIKTFKSVDSDCRGLMGITDYVDDEKPLYVDIDTDMNIIGYYDEPHGCRYISAGVYALPAASLDVLERCVSEGQSRMRSFQRELLMSGMSLKAYSFGKVVDVDHISDIEVAEKFLEQ